VADPTEIRKSGNRTNRKTNANLGVKAIGMPIGSSGRNLDPNTARNADNDVDAE
jgi:hypothetical protein